MIFFLWANNDKNTPTLQPQQTAITQANLDRLEVDNDYIKLLPYQTPTTKAVKREPLQKKNQYYCWWWWPF